jgi:hypothetical protein
MFIQAHILLKKKFWRQSIDCKPSAAARQALVQGRDERPPASPAGQITPFFPLRHAVLRL